MLKEPHDPNEYERDSVKEVREDDMISVMPKTTDIDGYQNSFSGDRDAERIVEDLSSS